MKQVIFFAILFASIMVYASPTIKKDDDKANIEGHIFDAKTKIPTEYVSIGVKGTSIGTVSDINGNFIMRGLKPGKYVLVFTCVGYQKVEKEVLVLKDKTEHVHVEMQEAKKLIDEIVVSANRVETSRKEAPIIVNVLSDKTFQQSNAQDVSQALPFQSGVRVEYNCQNCGFPQVRINGMEGPYSQILIDSRAIMSSLGGVYGLEQIPVNMIDRIEIVKGGASALFGSNAIAGTINIITKEPINPSYSISTDLSSIGMKAYAQNFNSNAVVISKDQKAGASFYQTFRKRNPYDYDNDGFSEIGKLDVFSFGTKSFFKINNTNKITLEYHTTKETRRGGDMFDFQPHLSNICEMTDHNIHSGGLSYDYISLDAKNRYSVYASGQYIDRDSYYGSNQDPNAYGKSKDFTLLLGTQGSNKIDNLIFLPASLVYGVEYSSNELHDEVKGHNILTNQKTNVYGGFGQIEWSSKKINFLLGGRLDKHNLIKNPIFSPRLNALYKPTENLQMRISYASGYRAPQAYEEDFHLTQVGGLSLRTFLAENLKPEYSNSLSFSLDYYLQLGDNYQTNLLFESFYTDLDDVFALKVIESDTINNIMIQERYNASGAVVKGISLTGKLTYKDLYSITLGYTLQSSKYKEIQFWSEDPKVEGTDQMLRTPNNYGYTTFSISPIKPLDISLTGTYTGKMKVPHFAGYIENDRIETTPSFFDLNVSLAYSFSLSKSTGIKLSVGMKNILDSYQNDFDKGINRDAGYIYGPMQPRTIYLGLNLFSN